MTWAAGIEPEPAHLPAPVHSRRPNRQQHRLRVAERVRRTQSARSRRAHPGRRRRLREAQLPAGRHRPDPRRDGRAVAHEHDSSTPGPEQVVTYADNQFAGVEIDSAPMSFDWSAWRSAQHTILFQVPELPSGLYYVQFTAADGRVGYAPFVVRPVILGQTSRVLVVLPTNTWQAYNFQDVNGNGYGDTWYAGPPNRTVNLGRTYIARGAPPRFYRYDLPFLHWLYWSGKQAEFISDSDFDSDRERRPARGQLRPDRVRGPRGVRAAARVRRRAALPRSRRQPDVPLGEQLLLEGSEEVPRHAAQDRPLARRGPAGGGADRRRVPRERRRPAPGSLHRAEQRRQRRGSGPAPA